MNPLEELMPGMFDPRFRPEEEDTNFAGGSIAGPNITLQRLIPYLMGAPGIVKGGKFGPPQGFQGEPGLNALGGPNIAPGAFNGMSNNQPAPQASSVGEGAFNQQPGFQTGPGGPGGPGYTNPLQGKTSLQGLLAQFGGTR